MGNYRLCLRLHITRKETWISQVQPDCTILDINNSTNKSELWEEMLNWMVTYGCEEGKGKEGRNRNLFNRKGIRMACSPPIMGRGWGARVYVITINNRIWGEMGTSGA